MRGVRFVFLPAAAFLSGASALGLQLAWTRRLAVGLGHEWPATLAVFTAFFAGMAAGAWGLSGPVRRSPRPWLWVVLLEGAIAAWALVSIPWLGWLGEASAPWTGAEPGWARFAWMSSWVTACGVLPGTVAMGATFAALERTWALLGNPAASAGAGRASSVPHGHVGTLYAWNTLGAMAGVFAALALFQPAVGLAGATVVAAAGNGVAAGLAWWAGRGMPARANEEARPTSHPGRGTPGREHTTQLAGIAAWLFLGGFLGMGLEVVSIRLLAPVLGGTVYSQATVLGAWLAGTALGAAPGWPTRPGRGGPRGLAWAWVAATTWAAWAMDWSGAGGMGPGSARGFWGGWLREAALVTVVVAPLAAASSQWLVRGMQRALDAGTGSGTALAWNLLGAAIAPCAWGTVAVPWLGERGAWAGLMALGWVLGAWAMPLQGRMGWAGWTRLAGLVVLGVIGVLPSLDLTGSPPGARRIRRVVGMSDTVEVMEWPDRSRTLAVNRRMTMGGTATAPAAARHAHVPLLLHPAPRRALFLGLGTGISFASAGAHPGLQAEGVELVPEVVEVLGEFAPENTLAPGLRVVTADARRFVRAPGPTYDVIVADLFHPERDGAAWLYTEEHFRAIRSRLAADGVACQWLPWFQLDARSRSAVVQAWLTVFPGSDAWLLRWTTLDTPVVGLVHGAGRVKPGDWASRVGTGPLREALRRSGLTDGWQLWGCWAGPASSLVRRGIGPNTDDHPVVLWTAARAADAARDDAVPALLAWLESVAVERPEWAGPTTAEADRWQRMRRARDLYLRGLDAAMKGHAAASMDRMWECVRASADFPTGYSHLLREALALQASRPDDARRILEGLARERPEVPVGRDLRDRMFRQDGP